MSEEIMTIGKSDFAVEYTSTGDLQKSFYKHCAMRQNKLMGIGFIVIGLMMLASTFMGAHGLLSGEAINGHKVLYLVLTAALAGVGVFMICTPSIMGGVSQKNIEQQHGGKAPDVTIMFGDCIYVSNNGGEPYGYPYSDVMTFVDTPDMFALMTSKQTGFIIPKEKFVKGELGNFTEYFKRKCVKTCGFRKA